MVQGLYQDARLKVVYGLPDPDTGQNWSMDPVNQ